MGSRFGHFFLLGLLLSAAPFAAPIQTDDRFVDQLLEKFDDVESTVDRIEGISEKFLGTPYRDGPLGEGVSGKYDNDPQICLTAFDCTTFVESVLALSTARDAQMFHVVLKAIRYKNGAVDFVHRNHFPDADWIPNNKWLLSDVTDTIGRPEDRAIAKAIVDRKGWYEKMTAARITRPDLSDEQKIALNETLKVEGAQFEAEEVSLPFIRLDAIFVLKPVSPEVQNIRAQLENEIAARYNVEVPDQKKAFDKELSAQKLKWRIEDSEINQALIDSIPSGSVVNIVRPNWNLKSAIGTNMNISHQGFVIRKNGVTLMRHASSSGSKQVAELPLADYLSAFLLSPTIKGINILSVKR